MTIKQIARSLIMRLATLRRDYDNLLRECIELRNRLTATALERDDLGRALAEKSIPAVYVSSPPSRENAFHIFNGAWSSDIPGYGFGGAGLFDDHRIKWFEQRCGGVNGKRILELGPLEGGHTYMLSRAGASVTSIESNTTAFLKCLIVQNALKFTADFILGDFRSYLEVCTDTYDLVVASGILYHMMEPVKLLHDMAKVSGSIGIWTHYYDDDVILKRDDLKLKFSTDPLVQDVGGCEVMSYKFSYRDALNWKGFCGGAAPTSHWMTKESILGVLSYLGFKVVIGEDVKEHPNGPALTLYASR